MHLKFCATFWGYEQTSPVDFLKEVVADGFSGAEINLASGLFDTADFRNALSPLRERGFVFIAQQVLDQKAETAREYTQRMVGRLSELARFEPDFINSQTGKDFYSFDDNCRIIDAAENFSHKSGIPIVHETHRGRFSFHLPALAAYLQQFPQLGLAADISHWCTVSESLLEEQQDLLAAVFANVRHIHARVGSQQSAQASDPFAPEWKHHLDTFTAWWQKIVSCHDGDFAQFTITPEAGPFPYMPQMPYSRQDLADQRQVNINMKNHLNATLYVR